MNDFTKEELEIVLTCVNAVSYNNATSAETVKSSQEKLKSMIDNYCEHEYLTFLAEQNNEPFVVKCIKCHKLDFFEKKV